MSSHLSPSTIRKPGIVLQIVGSGMLTPASIIGYTFVFQDFDFDALEKSTEYDNGLTEGSTLIRYDVLRGWNITSWVAQG